MPEALSVPTAFRHAGSSHVSSQKMSRTITSRVTISSRLEISSRIDISSDGGISSGLDATGVKRSSVVNDSGVDSGAVHSIGLSEAGVSEQNLDPLSRPLLTLHRLGAGDPARERVRAEVICAGLPLARKLARGFQRSGEPLDDLVQVATIGLIKSVDRFDIARGVPFARYAAPTIVGELKRYVRDVGWRMRIPRRLQELHLEIVGRIPGLTQQLGHTPSVAEIAAALGVSQSDVNAGLQCAAAYRPHSLNAPTYPSRSFGPNDATELGETLGWEDEELNHTIDRAALRQLIATLPERERRILALRFVSDLNQSQIAAQIGVSAMHVSRLLRRSLAVLRAGLLAEAA
jgi:RNA polymerase sigma-B factor